jgi:hypothetical protein
MWMPVLESKKLGRDPVRVVYWGSPVLLIRRESGEISAVEDAYAHRLTRYFVREAAGHVFISVEDEPAAPFPLDDRAIRSTEWIVGKRELEGDVLVWMDHVLDWAHVHYAHPRALLGAPDISVSVSDPMPASDETRYPVLGALHASFEAAPRAPLSHRVLQTRGPWDLLKQLFRPSTHRIFLQQSIHSPASHDFVFRVTRGESVIGDYSTLLFYNQVAPGRIRATAIGRSIRPARWPWGSLQRRVFAWLLGVVQVLKEDALFLSQASSDARRFRLTPADASIARQRTLTARYLRAKAHLYPADSLIHTLKDQPGVEAPHEATPAPARSERVVRARSRRSVAVAVG